MSDKEQRIREVAYRLWDEEGRPFGQELRHWDMAILEITGASVEDATSTDAAKASTASPCAKGRGVEACR